MAKTYAAGDQTKEKIIKEAKKLIYKQGFSKTTYDNISKAASINRALIPYHFKSKQILGQTIYEESINGFLNRFDSILEVSDFTPDFVSILHLVAYYQLLTIPTFSRFVNELQADSSFSAFMETSEREIMSGLLVKASKLRETEQNILINSLIGMKKELIRMVAEKHTGFNINEAAKIQLYMILSYTGYTKKKIEELYDSAVEVVNLLKFDLSGSFELQISFK